MKAVVISFDHLPLNVLGCYGNHSVETPHWNRLAAESAVFDFHFGENFDPSSRNHAWWTGCFQFPASHDEQQHAFPSAIEKLRQRAVSTRLLITTGARVPGALRHFDELAEIGVVEPATGRSSVESNGAWEHAAIEHIRGLGAAPDRSDLLWLHSCGVLASHSPDDCSEAAIRSRCALAVNQLDAQLGRLLEALAPLLSAGNCLLVVTAAAGAPASLPADNLDPLSRLTEELVHAPLFLAYRSNPGAQGRFSSLVQTVDVSATLLDWFGIPLESELCDGMSLLPLIRGERKRVRESVVLGWGSEAWGIRSEDFFFRRGFADSQVSDAESGQLFLKPEDRWDVADVVRQFPEVALDFERRLNDIARLHRLQIQSSIVQMT